MKKVFVSGSMSIKTLTQREKETLENLASQEETMFLIGDAPGVDRLVQKYLHELGCRRVIVYHVGNARNNIGNWKTVAVPTCGERGRDWYAVKDFAMTHDCTVGWVLWDGKSEGTYNNIMRLKSIAKDIVYTRSIPQ